MASLSTALSSASLASTGLVGSRSATKLPIAPLSARPSLHCTTSSYARAHRLMCGNGKHQSSKQDEPVVKQAIDAGYLRTLNTKKTIVVLGSGWGAASFISGLDPALFGEEGEYDLVVVSPRDYFVYTPLLPAVASGAIEASSVTTPIRTIIGNRGRFACASVSDIDFDRKVVKCRKSGKKHYVDPESCRAGGACEILEEDYVYEYELYYDVLVSSIGAKTATFGVPGVEEHCISIRTAEDSERLRRCFEDSLRKACSVDVSTGFEEIRRLMSVVVVGGGPTGVEVAAELQDMLDSGYESFCSTKGYCAPLWPTVYLVTNTPALLPTFSEKASKYATKRLQDTGVVEMLDSVALKVEKDGVLVRNEKLGRDFFLNSATVVWAGGVEASGLTKSCAAKFSKNTGISAKRGVVVDDYLRPVGSDGSVFWIGDAAATSENHSEQLPPTAQVARSQGEYVSNLFNSGSIEYSVVGRGRVDFSTSDKADRFRYVSKGCMAYVGQNAAAIDFPNGDAITGLGAGLLWKAFETVSQQTTANKLAVAADFAKTVVKGREIRATEE